MSETVYDAVIIGAGHNSLACGVVLSQAGWSVLALEQSETPGGAVKTGEYTVPGFRHDWGAMNLSLFAGSPFMQSYGDELRAAGLDFVQVEDCFASVFPDGRWLGIGVDRQANAVRVAAFSEADAAAWSRLSDAFPGDAKHLFAILGGPFDKFAFAKVVWNLWRDKGIAGSLDFSRFLTLSPRAWLSETFESDHVRATLAAWGMHLDFAPDIAGGALFPYLEAMTNQAFGMALGKGGAETIVRAMTLRIEGAGGEIRCGTRVMRIECEGGRAKAAVLDDGTRIGAKRAVIANVAPKALAGLIDEAETGYGAGLRRFRHAPGTLMLHLAMDDLPDWLASQELRRYAYVHLAPSLDQMSRTYAQAMSGLLPDEPVVVVGQPTVADPSRAPAGKHVLWMQVRMTPGAIVGDSADQITARSWKDTGEPMADRAINILDRYAPGVRDKIIARRVVTPEELEADNPNLVGGDQLCGSHHIAQHFLFRPMRGRSDGGTPVRNLYHTGAAVWPGAGTGAGSGYMLGKKLTQQHRN